MREILFRGKRKDNGNWIYGTVVYPRSIKGKNYTAIVPIVDGESVYSMIREVIPETVGQFTGLTDLHGKKIFEGDIIKIRFESDSFTHPVESIVWYDIAKVFWLSEHFGWFAAFASGEELSLWEYDDPDDVEIVGNIHDNQELLEEVK